MAEVGVDTEMQMLQKDLSALANAVSVLAGLVSISNENTSFGDPGVAEQVRLDAEAISLQNFPAGS